jgi:glycosyltransferase involved in cell wall biosynthesis
LRAVIGAFERRWARKVDRVITVNRPYADILARRLGIAPPAVVMNCPEAWTPSEPPPDLIRTALGLAAGTRVVLYQGQLITDRGLEQAIEAIPEVPDAALVLLGFGRLEGALRRAATEQRYLGRVFVLPPVPPDDLLAWSASADVLVMPIQPTSLNHRYTTPQKLFEAIAVGVPVVASDLPGMAEIVRAIDAGLLCDPTSPASISAAIRGVLDVDEATRAARRLRILAAAHDRYSWEAQAAVLHGLYRELLERPEPDGR